MPIALSALVDPLPHGLEDLAQAAQRDGFEHIRRLVEEWEQGKNRFRRRGERLLAASDGDMLVGIGGMTIELSRPDWLRMRRFYVMPGHRRQGVARMMAEDLIGHARGTTNTITVHAGDETASLFWQALGFRPCRRENYTHILELA